MEAEKQRSDIEKLEKELLQSEKAIMASIACNDLLEYTERRNKFDFFCRDNEKHEKESLLLIKQEEKRQKIQKKEQKQLEKEQKKLAKIKNKETPKLIEILPPPIVRYLLLFTDLQTYAAFCRLNKHFNSICNQTNFKSQMIEIHRIARTDKAALRFFNPFTIVYKNSFSKHPQIKTFVTEFDKNRKLRIKTSKEIEKNLNEHKREMDKEIKILFLGTDENGIDVLMKQLRLLHGVGFNEQEKLEFKPFILQSILNGMKQLVQCCDQSQIPIEEKHKEISKELREMDDLNNFSVDANKAMKLIELWKSESIQKAYNFSTEFCSNTSFNFLVNKIEEIIKLEYCPTMEDIFNVHIKSSHLKELSYSVYGSKFTLIYYPGEKMAAKKWMHQFMDVNSIIFVADLTDYERFLQDPKENKLDDAISSFRNIFDSRWFRHATKTLFLSKKDLFEQRIKESPLSNFFTEYLGPNEFEPSARFIDNKFKETLQKDRVYSHFICDVDANNIKYVWQEVQALTRNSCMCCIGIDF